MKTIRFLSPAEAELLDAAHYYELQAPGLGVDFLDQIDAALQDIRANPARWPTIRGKVRRRLVSRFPYALLYRLDNDEIVIQATMHLHRRPGYWVDR